MFFGYYLSAATMTREENGPPVPELARRMILTSCELDPVRALAPVLTRMPGNGIPLGDVLADSGYAHRAAETWATPLRLAGAQLVQDLHPSDRGPQGTHHGAIIANGSLYCPQTPAPLLQIGLLPPGSMTLDRDRPEILTPPQNPSAYCTQQTITVGAEVAAKTRQKLNYPSKAHRISYHRRTGSERTFSNIKDAM